jgi:hypothetical protein
VSTKLNGKESAEIAGLTYGTLNHLVRTGAVRPGPRKPGDAKRRYSTRAAFAIAVIAKLHTIGINNTDVLARVNHFITTADLKAHFAVGEKLLVVNQQTALLCVEGATLTHDGAAAAFIVDLERSWKAFEAKLQSVLARQNAGQARQDAPADQEAAGPSDDSDAACEDVEASVEDFAGK